MWNLKILQYGYGNKSLDTYIFTVLNYFTTYLKNLNCL